MGHKLCPRCQHLSFRLHLQDCKSLACKVMDLTTCALHSEMIFHSPSLTDLDQSASNGCHLCSLRSIGLLSASRIPTTYAGKPQEGVHVFFKSRTTNPWDIHEKLIAICGDIITAFDVTCVPGSRCSQPDHANQPARDVIFRAVYTGVGDRNKDLYAGQVNKLFLLNYLSIIDGRQYHDVFDIKGDSWLVRGASYSKYSRDWERSKQWAPGCKFGN
jgi:hypothetical protein